MLEALDYTEDEVAKLRLEDIIHPDHLAAYMDRFQRAMAGNEVERIHTVFVGRRATACMWNGTTNVRSVDGEADRIQKHLHGHYTCTLGP